jgi:hypothetical protein
MECLIRSNNELGDGYGNEKYCGNGEGYSFGEAFRSGTGYGSSSICEDGEGYGIGAGNGDGYSDGKGSG